MLNKYFDQKGNFKNLREEIDKKRIKSYDDFGIPFIGMYLTELMFEFLFLTNFYFFRFIEERHSDLKFDLINWKKRKLQSKIIFDIQQFQRNLYDIKDYPELRETLIHDSIPEMEELYALSLQIEQKGI